MTELMVVAVMTVFILAMAWVTLAALAGPPGCPLCGARLRAIESREPGLRRFYCGVCHGRGK